MTKMIAVAMSPASAYRTEHYGVLHSSAFVYRTSKTHSPTRVDVWDNTRRLNPDDGGPIQHGKYGPIGGGNGKYLDPHNKATDAERSVLLTPECTVITAQRNGTGHPDSGQVWAKPVLNDGDQIVLVYLDGSAEVATVVFPRYGNGHGHAELMDLEVAAA